ncbi:LysR family transcriptional regulator [Parasphingorhabdus sp.]|uniref:LysR family transcriptional regulator n=1 Tax=Parasphingorhabdus sp. TaxID=2709688 RepID=UPI003C77B9C9
MMREILRHGSVGKAAEALNISQPALSGALKQLRKQFDDDLIVRSGKSMKLTPKGETILAPLEKVLADLEGLVFESDGAGSDVATSLVIATNDHVMTILGAPLGKRVVSQKLNYLPQFVTGSANSLLDLAAGTIDFIIAPRLGLMGGTPASSSKMAQMNSELLFSEPLVGVASPDDHELAEPISLDAYLGRPHIGFDVGLGRDLSNEQIFLASLGLRQNESIRFSSYSALVDTVVATNSIGLVPASFARLNEGRLGLKVFVPPIQFPPLEYNLVWLRTRDGDPYFEKFRSELREIVSRSRISS